MTDTPPANQPPADPDAGLSDEQKTQKGLFKGWFKEAFAEFVEENKPEEPAPERTKKPSGGLFDMLFGGSGSHD